MRPFLGRLWARVLEARPRTNRTLLIETAKMALLLHVFIRHAYTIKGTRGASMLPTMAADGEGVVINKKYRRGRYIEVGDLVSVRHLFEPEEAAIKRVMGMPGDFVLRDTPGKGEGLMVQVGVHAVGFIIYTG
ncbi:hypothetical protein W97_09150 [Coniosporium apollinis CBS 100218]|uniref:Peptidase S26 domain-containing protein n=1 Tax=Coniosporium apollinis (strain CBS 100218) TaxID=1168221 RepID=R7Z7G5_CONA1|nr:uncharacterized protein W97_09150 [Coniosporium apollinis CBS 100218]EON69886.1 hypothetical protein W97_09150 [Coniosporium apollinis CBS 100218]